MVGSGAAQRGTIRQNPGLIPLMIVGLIILSVFAAFAYDIKRKADSHQAHSMSGWNWKSDRLSCPFIVNIHLQRDEAA